MARAGINKALVQRARDALLARGEHPSIEAVRVELGNTGSKSTILRYLQELQAAEPHPPSVSLDDELQTFISSLAQRLAADAQASVAADRARLQRQQAAYEQQRAVDQARFEQLQLAHDALSTERREAQQRENALQRQVQQLEGERQRLLAGEQHAAQLLEERAQYIQSLEDKHQQARDALAHYRQQHLAQREQELHRHDQQVQQLQLELRQAQEQSIGKHEEVAQLYRELERLSHASQNHLREARQHSHALEHSQMQVVKLNQSLQLAETSLQTRTVEISVLREKARRYVLDHREDRRALRAQAKLVAQLRELLRPAQLPIQPDGVGG
ncbi:transposase [Pseudomonas plecoglossicida]|uniref:Transposase n=1 Tax=Pseudomonas plecoglossicida TaxID=70775 RepID=A0A2R7UCY8_PSEDL|nr:MULTISPECIES: DNA-binding protein [Pseudomonas]MDM9556407.1 DNA-binding protein [Pseudomonas asiatica]PTU49212.1 transposase [Pseudomonas plecoglossicida]